MRRVAVVGGTGYGGAEAVRLLLRHSGFEVAYVTSGRAAGEPLAAHCPWLQTDLKLSSYEPDGWKEVDAVLLAQESGFAAERAPELLARDLRVVDLSADFRISDAQAYEAHYGRPASPALGQVYGLPEWGDRRAIGKAALVANPGCHPTAAAMALMPLIEAGLVAGTPVVDSKTGVSGAGRSRRESEYLFSEATDDFRAYGAVGHRHTPEIEMLAGRAVRFTPHLIPVARGLLATVHAPLNAEVDLMALYQEQYRGEPFVRVQDRPAQVKAVRGTNRCDVYPLWDARTGYAVVTAAIDNLGKGAAGQAVQNLNLMFGYSETEGLLEDGVWP